MVTGFSPLNSAEDLHHLTSCADLHMVVHYQWYNFVASFINDTRKVSLLLQHIFGQVLIIINTHNGVLHSLYLLRLVLLYGLYSPARTSARTPSHTQPPCLRRESLSSTEESRSQTPIQTPVHYCMKLRR